MDKSAKLGGLLFEKKQGTCIAKFGVSNTFQSEEKKKKMKDTSLQRFGVEHHLKSEEQKEKLRDTIRKKYGTDNVFQSDIIKDRMRNTWLKKYGVLNPMQNEEIKSKFNHEEIQKKGHATKKKNKSYGKSKVEDAFFSYLCERFECVERQVQIKDWCIDFKVNDFYVQLDGVYWHGLDRDVETISKLKNSHDSMILKTKIRDEAQNQWFSSQNLKLIRVTDVDFINGKIDLSSISRGDS